MIWPMVRQLLARLRGTPRPAPNPAEPSAEPPAGPPPEFTQAVAAGRCLLHYRRRIRREAGEAWDRRPATAGIRELMVALARPRQWEYLTYPARHPLHTELPDMDLKSLFFDVVVPPGERDSFIAEAWGRRLAPGERFAVDPARHVVLAHPRNRRDFLETLGYIGAPGCPWAHDEGNHRATLLDPFGLVTVEGGNHSITAGLLRGELALQVTHYADLRPWLAGLRCDGREVTRARDGAVVGRVRDPVFGALLELGRLYVEWEQEELGGQAPP